MTRKKWKPLKASLKFKHGVIRDIVLSSGKNSQKFAAPVLVSAPNSRPQIVTTPSFVEYTLFDATVSLYKYGTYHFYQPEVLFRMEHVAESYRLLEQRYGLKTIAYLYGYTLALASNGHFMIVEQLYADKREVRYAFSPIAISDEGLKSASIEAYKHREDAQTDEFEACCRIRFRDNAVLWISVGMRNNSLVFSGEGEGFLPLNP